MTERNWKKEANTYLKKMYLEYAADRKDCPAKLPKYSPPLALWEAKYFMLGLKKSLFSVDHESYVQTGMLYPARRKNDKQRTIQLIGKKRSGSEERNIGLFRENVCQMATASYLSIHDKWDVSEIEMEPPRKVYGDLEYAVDILLRENKESVAICCEVKRNKEEFDKLMREFKYCCERGDHKEEECKRKNHPKFDMCWELRPKYFYAISPEDRQCFELTYVVDAIQLHPIDALPTKVEYMPKRFLHSEFWLHSWKAAMPRPRKLYDPEATEPERKKFRQYVSAYCEKYLLHQYKTDEVSAADHCKNIEKLQSHVNHEYPYKKVLYGSHFNIGVAQKLLNLQLKYLWCMGEIKTPPHCPVDSIIQKKIKSKDRCNWTEIDSIPRYEKVIKAITEQATKDGYKSIAEWELCKYRRR